MIFLELIKLLTTTWLSRTRCVLMGHALSSVPPSLAARGRHAVLRSVLLKAEHLGLYPLVAPVVLTRSILCGVLLPHLHSVRSWGRACMSCWAGCSQWSVTSPCPVSLMLCKYGRSCHARATCSNGPWWLWYHIWVNGNVTVWSYGGV